jgi:hypothetical protein
MRNIKCVGEERARKPLETEKAIKRKSEVTKAVKRGDKCKRNEPWLCSSIESIAFSQKQLVDAFLSGMRDQTSSYSASFLPYFPSSFPSISRSFDSAQQGLKCGRLYTGSNALLRYLQYFNNVFRPMLSNFVPGSLIKF